MRICILITLLFCLAGQAFAQDKPITFAFLTDIHVSPHAVSEKNLEKIVQEINEGNYDFVVVTGDLTNTGSDSELIAVKRILSELTPPLHVVPGNHETNWSESACQTFLRLWGNDRFFFEWGKYLFVGFNTGPYMKMGDGHVREGDLRWLKNILDKNSKPGKTVISLAHYPLGDGLDNWFDVTDILKHYHTLLTLCGHGHRLSLHNFDGIPGVMGRSSLPKRGEPAGYNIVRISNDSVYVYEKLLGHTVEKPFVVFDLNHPSRFNSIKIAPRPDFSINNKYSSVDIPFSFQDTASIFTAALPVNKHMIIYGTSLGKGIAMDTRNKKQVWSKSYTGSIYATPVIGKGIAVFGTVDGILSGLDCKTGKEKWRLQVGDPVIADGIAEDGTLYIGVGSTSFYKINIKNGKVIWKNTSMSGQMQGKPALTDKDVVFGAWDRHLYCLDKATGKLKWKWDNGKPQKLYSPGNVVPAIANGKVFIVAPDRYMTAIDLATGKTIWRDNSRRVRESMTISEDGNEIYAKLMNDTVIAVSTQGNEFRLLWEVNGGFGYEHNPCPLLEYNGVVYAGTKNGLLVAIDASGKKVLWENKAGNSSINKIVAGRNGGIWISLIEGKILEYKN